MLSLLKQTTFHLDMGEGTQHYLDVGFFSLFLHILLISRESFFLISERAIRIRFVFSTEHLRLISHDKCRRWLVEPNQPITLPLRHPLLLSHQSKHYLLLWENPLGKTIISAKRSKKETALEREKRKMNEVKKRLLANPYSLTSSGASEFVFLPPQLQHLRNLCLLQ